MSQFISKAEAVAMTSRYRLHRESILETLYRGQDILPLSETFSNPDVAKLLTISGCTKLRVYYGMDEDYKVHAILVGVNADGEDILPADTLTTAEEEDLILERATRCPDICPPESDLNS